MLTLYRGSIRSFPAEYLPAGIFTLQMEMPAEMNAD